MFIFNISLKKNSILKYSVFLLTGIILVLLVIFLFLKFYSSGYEHVNDDYSNEIIEIAPENYSTFLDNCYSHLDDYVGKKIKFTGFVYRLYDFQENEFVLGREMIISKISDTEAKVVVIGFLCASDSASSYKTGDWVEIEGTITKGYYHSELPVVTVDSIRQADCPENPLVTDKTKF